MGRFVISVIIAAGLIEGSVPIGWKVAVSIDRRGSGWCWQEMRYDGGVGGFVRSDNCDVNIVISRDVYIMKSCTVIVRTFIKSGDVYLFEIY